MSVHEYACSQPFEAGAFDAAAMYCSDGRFVGQVDEFLRDHLQLTRIDRMVVPGGPACLAGQFDGYRMGETIFEQLKFLIEAHELKRVILIAHDDCGYYQQQLGVRPAELRGRQCEDLAKAVERVRGIDTRLTVDAFVEQVDGDTVRFQPLDAARQTSR